jgi:arabinofuranosyltransferase
MGDSPHETRPIDRVLLGIVALLGGTGLVVGWRVFWFLTDDAFIAFRYVSNSILGYGYVWNPPPFLPVEGYTSFLWVVLLDGVWRLTGVEPPASANLIALGFAAGSLFIAAAMARRISWTIGRWDTRILFVGAMTGFLVVNRTFLAWSSSGLETSLVTFLVLLWVFAALSEWSPVRRAAWSAATAATLALTRPDGLLFCAATVALVAALAMRTEGRARVKTVVAGLAPFVVVIAHLAWRLQFYGQWLPNTYYAKVVEPWPESGLRYLFSFVLEYGLWFAAAVILWSVAGAVRDWLPTAVAEWSRKRAGQAVARWFGQHGPRLIVIGAIVLHAGYYTLIVGGDHFEYRIYTHLLPLGFAALIWSLHRMNISVAAAAGVCVAFIALSLPVPWVHWAKTHDLTTRIQTHVMRVPVAPSFPKPLRWYARLFDEQQSWLIDHHVCMRHQEHKIYWKTQIRQYPTRQQGAEISGEGWPVFPCWNVGVPGWVLPEIVVIDLLGLNDAVIAHTPVEIDENRHMAHSRRPPEAYVDGFRPNVTVRARRAQVEPRDRPLSRTEIEEHERRWREGLTDAGGRAD